MDRGDWQSTSSAGTTQRPRKPRANLVRWVGITLLGLFVLGLIAELLVPA